MFFVNNISSTYLSVCLFVRPFVRWVRVSVHLSVSLTAVFLSQLLFLTPHKNVIKDRFLDISMRVIFNKIFFNMKDYIHI